MTAGSARTAPTVLEPGSPAPNTPAQSAGSAGSAGPAGSPECAGPADFTGPTTEPRSNVRGPRRAALALLRAYQGGASGRVSPCRFYPSCSNYAVEAFEVHGFWRATALTARRLIRCRPFGPHGVDLVPLPAHRHGSGGVHEPGGAEPRRDGGRPEARDGRQERKP